MPSERKLQIEYNPESDTYTLDVHWDVKETCRATPEIVDAYEKERFSDIFPDFNPDQERIDNSYYGSDTYFLRVSKGGAASNKEYLDPGFYKFKSIRNDIGFTKMQSSSVDEHIELSQDQQKIFRDLSVFFDKEELYEEYNLRYQRGTLVYGPPGNGKTHTILRAARNCVENHECRVFYLPSSIKKLETIGEFGVVFENIPTILILEEITDHTNRKSELLLNLLDGEISWENNYVIATTNQPEELPTKLIDRPGRFDSLIPVNPPNRQNRRRYLLSKLNKEQITKEILDATDGFSVAYLKELVLRTELYDQNLETTLKEFREIKRKIEDSFRGVEDLPGFVTDGK